MNPIDLGYLVGLLGIGIAVGGSGSILVTKADRRLVDGYRKNMKNQIEPTVEQKIAHSNQIAYIFGMVLFFIGVLISLNGLIFGGR